MHLYLYLSNLLCACKYFNISFTKVLFIINIIVCINIHEKTTGAKLLTTNPLC